MAHYPLLFGISCALILVLFLSALGYCARQRLPVDAAETTPDLQDN